MSTHARIVCYLSIGLLLVFGWHFATVFGLIGTAPTTQSAFFIRLGLILTAYVAAAFVTAVLVGRHDERAALPDERDEKFELKAERSGAIAIYAGLLALAWFAFLPLTPMQVANGILAVVCFTEIVKLSSYVYFLRRGV